jgi:hypothetical protein
MTTSITLTDAAPRPPQADFAFEIDFARGVGPASRVFTATADFIKACENIDSELVKSIDNSIETVLVLEDIQQGSIKTWLRYALKSTNDDALKSLDWKKQVGTYLVKAKYAILRFTDDENMESNLPALREEVRQIAVDTDVRYLPDYSPPSPKALISAVKDFQSVKDKLVDGDKARLISDITDLPAFEFNLSVRIPIEDIEQMAVSRTTTVESAEMILPVKKPDYLGESRWQLRHGQRNIDAKLEDLEWLKEFQGRKVDVRPGDALRCSVKIEYLYGFDNELLGEKYTITRVMEVLANRYNSPQLPLDQN